MVLANRRRFLNAGLYALGGCILAPGNSGADSPGFFGSFGSSGYFDSNQSFDSLDALIEEVSFRDAVREKPLRQKYVEQVARRLFGRSPEYSKVANWLYDEDHELALNKYVEIESAIARQPERLAEVKNNLRLGTNMNDAVTFLVQDGLFPEVGMAERRLKIGAFLNTDDGLTTLANRVVKKKSPEFHREMKRTFAQTIGMWEKNEVSVYVHGELFDGMRISHQLGHISSSKELFECMMIHEFQHVKDLLNDVELDGKVVRLFGTEEISESSAKFIMENRGYGAGFEYARKFNEDLPAGARYHPAYLVSAILWRDYWLKKQVPAYTMLTSAFWFDFFEKPNVILKSEWRKGLALYDEAAIACAYALKNKHLLR